MIVGFTGTQDGTTSRQYFTLCRLLDRLRPSSVNHGCCVGADHDFADICRSMGIKATGFPSTLHWKTSKEACEWAWFLHPKQPPLDRNLLIVAASDFMVACPKSTEEELRSGTWATVRYTRKASKPLCIIWPHGGMTFERAESVRELADCVVES